MTMVKKEPEQKRNFEGGKGFTSTVVTFFSFFTLPNGVLCSVNYSFCRLNSREISQTGASLVFA